MRKLSLILVIFLMFFIPTVLAFESTQECLNSSHLEKLIKWTECDNTCEDKNITQVVNCTHGCDTTYNQCKYIERSGTGNIAAVLVLTFITGSFFFLGIKVQPSKEFSMLKNGIQTLFLILGMFLLVLDIGMAETIAVSSGVSENTQSSIGTGVLVVSYAIYIVIVLLMLSYLISTLWLMLPGK